MKGSRQPRTLVALLAALVGAASGCADSANETPVVAPISAMEVVVGEVLEVSLTATDANRDPLNFVVLGAPSGVEVVADDDTTATLRWAPLVTDAEPLGRTHEIIVRATDPDGAFGETTLVVRVYPQLGPPEILTGAFASWDGRLGPWLSHPIEARDDDSVSLEFALLDGPPGLELLPGGAKSAVLVWRTTAELRAESALATARISVSDGVHAPVVQVIGLIVLDAAASECPGEPPGVIAASPDGLSAVALDPEGAVASIEVDAPDSANGYVRDELAQWSWPTATAPLPGILRATDNADPLSDACDRTSYWPKGVSWPPAPGAGWLLASEEPTWVEVPAGSTASRLRLRTSVEPRLLLVTAPDSDTAAEFAYAGEVAIGPQGASVALDAGPPTWVQWELFDSAAECVNDSGDDGSDSNTPALLPPSGVDAAICPFDVDAWSFEVSQGSVATLELNFSHADADLDLAVLAPDGSHLVGRGHSVDSHERVRFLAAQSGEYVAVVYAAGDDDSAAAYSLIASVAPADAAAPGCLDDALGAGDSPEQAADLRQGRSEPIVLCPGRPKYLRLEGNATDELSVTVTPTGDGPVAVDVLREETGESLASANRAVAARSGPVSLSAPFDIEGGLLIRLEAPTATAPGAVVAVDLAVAPAAGCAPDRLEPNGVGLPAVRLGPGVHTALSLCDGSDAYEVQAELGSRIQTAFWPLEPDLPLAVRWLTPHGAVHQELALPTAEALDFIAPTAGAWRLEIEPLSEAIATTARAYDLAIDLTPL